MPAEGMWNSKLGNSYPKVEIERMEEELAAMLRKIRSKPENAKCCDCGGSDGMLWAVVNIGSFVCVKCASIHRGVGTHISKVKGLAGTYLWGPDEVENMIGNARIAEIYGGAVPGPDVGEATMRSFILDRYDKKRWYDARAAAARDAIPVAQRQIHLPTVAPFANAQQAQPQTIDAAEPDFFNLLDFDADTAPAVGQQKQKTLGGADQEKLNPFDQVEEAPRLANQQGASPTSGGVFRFDPFGAGIVASSPSTPIAVAIPCVAGGQQQLDLPTAAGRYVEPVSKKIEEPKKRIEDSFDHFFDECLRDDA